MSMHSIYARISPVFRRKRQQLFQHTLNPTEQTRILDVGGTASFWQTYPVKAQITLLNILPVPQEDRNPRFQYVTCDACELPFQNASYDIVFSNSVIEHLGSIERQRKFAKEMRRTGRALWIQTPAWAFPIEPHYIAPLIHWMPRAMRPFMARYATLWGWLSRPTKEEAQARVDEINLLTYHQFQTLFPDCHIQVERLCGFPKSYTAWQGFQK